MANNVTLSYPSAFHHQFLDLNGKPLTGGKLYTYSAGTPTPVPTYKTIGDTSSTNTNTNPIILDNAGMAYIVIETDKAYKFVLFDKNDAKIAEWDNVTGNIGGGGGRSEDIVVVGTPNEIDVSGSVTQGVKKFIISLAENIKNSISSLLSSVNDIIEMIPLSASSSNKLATYDNVNKLSSSIAPIFNPERAETYPANSLVMYENVLYRFDVDHPTGAWTGDDATDVDIANSIKGFWADGSVSILSNKVTNIEYFKAAENVVEKLVAIDVWFVVNASNLVSGWNERLIRINIGAIQFPFIGFCLWNNTAGESLNKMTQISLNYDNVNGYAYLDLFKPSGVSGNCIIYTNSILLPLS